MSKRFNKKKIKKDRTVCKDCKRPNTLRRHEVISVIQKTEYPLVDLDFLNKKKLI